MYDYEEYYEDDYDYDEDVINESALDMAMDMSDRYGVAIEDAYDFACDAMEGSLKDPRKRELRETGRLQIASNAVRNARRDMENENYREASFAGRRIHQRGKIPGAPKDASGVNQKAVDNYNNAIRNRADLTRKYANVVGDRSLKRASDVSDMQRDEFRAHQRYNRSKPESVTRKLYEHKYGKS